MKKISVIIALLFVTACQASPDTSSPTASAITVLNAPASDAADSLDFSKLPADFPVIAEMALLAAPKGCGLSKLNRAAGTSDIDTRYVFTSSGADGLYQVGINGAVRTFKQSETADMETKKVRYFKTVDAPEVEIQVVLETSDSPQKSIVGRVKAWDAGVPLMCAYNRIEVEGDCDL